MIKNLTIAKRCKTCHWMAVYEFQTGKHIPANYCMNEKGTLESKCPAYMKEQKEDEE